VIAGGQKRAQAVAPMDDPEPTVIKLTLAPILSLYAVQSRWLLVYFFQTFSRPALTISLASSARF
jgi:hypothetical protein